MKGASTMFTPLHRRRLANLSIAAASALAIGLAAERFDYKVREDFFIGFSGNQAALDRGMKACEETLRGNPKHAEAMVWHGTGLFFLAGQSFQKGDFQKGKEQWDGGLKEMEAAVALDPENVAVRIPRGAGLIQASLFVPPDFAAKSSKRGWPISR